MAILFLGTCLSLLSFTRLYTLQRWAPAFIPTKPVTSVTSGTSQVLLELREWEWRNEQRSRTPIITLMKGLHMTGLRGVPGLLNNVSTSTTSKY